MGKCQQKNVWLFVHNVLMTGSQWLANHYLLVLYRVFCLRKAFNNS
jgi:hypothetical protein